MFEGIIFNLREYTGCLRSFWGFYMPVLLKK
jgi:hypothetical protein